MEKVCRSAVLIALACAALLPGSTAALPFAAGQEAQATAAPSSPPLPLPPPYGPVLGPRIPSAAPAVTAEPATPPAPAAAAPAPSRRAAPARRRSVWQVIEPPPARSSTAADPVLPSPPRPATPRPVGPTSTLAGSCQGGLCTDAAGNSYHGNGPAGVSIGNNDGRLCVRGTATVQCF